eukprot:9561359-Karenia_brevis.AAC.1
MKKNNFSFVYDTCDLESSGAGTLGVDLIEDVEARIENPTWTCHLENEKGERCNKSFDSKNGLLFHQ